MAIISKSREARAPGAFVSSSYFAIARRCALLVSLTAVACTAEVLGDPTKEMEPGATATVPDSSGSAGTAATLGPTASSPPLASDPTGLPCEVAALLQHYCVGCHSSPPTGGAPNALLNYDALIAKSSLDATQQVGAMSVKLMASGAMPPKPSPAPTAAEQAAVQAWVTAGMPRSGCSAPISGPVAMDPYGTPLQCSSGTTWTRGDKGSAQMHPGLPCVACHTMQGGGGENEAPRFTIGGTVYRTAHEPNDCNGTSTSSSGTLSVLITEANGKTHNLAVNTAGNFSYTGSIATPYTAQVTAGSAVRAMTHTQTSGDCNGCHTVNGSSTTTGAASAPGRIMAP